MSSYIAITIPNPDEELQQQGVLLLRQLLADGLIKTNQYMLYTDCDQQEVRIAADPFAVVTVTLETVSLQHIDTGETRQESLAFNPLKQVERLLASILLPDALVYGYISFLLALAVMSPAK